jgi:hypothetical protein
MITKHDTVYIAGPMTGKPNYNFQAFNEAESYLHNTYACRVCNPASFGALVLRHAGNTLLANDIAIDITMEALKLCTKLYLLNGWEESRGAIREVDYAIKNNMQIIKQDYDFNKCSQ